LTWCGVGFGAKILDLTGQYSDSSAFYVAAFEA